MLRRRRTVIEKPSLKAIGGKKYAFSRRRRGLGKIFPRSLLIGGLPIESITPVKYLGGETEGNVYLVDVVFKSKKLGKLHTVRMACKNFHTLHFSRYYSKHNPPLQLENMSELIELNRERNLGLNLPTTVRLVADGKTMKLLTTYTPTVRSPTTKEIEAYGKDAERQIDILHKNGFGLQEPIDQFDMIRDSRGAIRAALVDLGGIVKLADHKRNYRLSGEIRRVSLRLMRRKFMKMFRG